LTEESFPPDLEFALTHGPPHQIRDDGTLVLITECFVELHLDFIGYAEIYGCHPRPLVETFNNPNIRLSLRASMAIPPEFLIPIARSTIQSLPVLVRGI
jgi:hypothetical protein